MLLALQSNLPESHLKQTEGAAAIISFAGALKATMLAISDMSAGKETDKPWGFSTIPESEGGLRKRGVSDGMLGMGNRDICTARKFAGGKFV